MPTKPYYVNGKRVPGVTGVIGHRKCAEGLIHWAWNEGREGRDYRETKGTAADKGTIVHRMIDRHSAGLDPFDLDGAEVTDEDCLRAFSGFADWFDKADVEIVASEVSLVSLVHGFGGTLDSILIFRVSGSLAIGDWKTSKAIYGDFIIQIAAYAQLWNEHHPDDPIVGGGHLLRFDKETAGYEHIRVSMDVLGIGFAAFLKLLDIYRTDRELEKAIRPPKPRRKKEAA